MFAPVRHNKRAEICAYVLAKTTQHVAIPGKRRLHAAAKRGAANGIALPEVAPADVNADGRQRVARKPGLSGDAQQRLPNERVVPSERREVTF